jgi:SPW repeat
MMETRTRWQDWVNLFLGLWLFFTPFFGFGLMTGAPAYNGYIFGAMIASLSILALARPQAWEEWINLVIGLWLIVAPFVLFGYLAGSVMMWNSIVIGLLVGGDALWAMASRPMGPTHHMPHHA